MDNNNSNNNSNGNKNDTSMAEPVTKNPDLNTGDGSPQISEVPRRTFSQTTAS